MSITSWAIQPSHNKITTVAGALVADDFYDCFAIESVYKMSGETTNPAIDQYLYHLNPLFSSPDEALAEVKAWLERRVPARNADLPSDPPESEIIRFGAVLVEIAPSIINPSSDDDHPINE